MPTPILTSSSPDSPVIMATRVKIVIISTTTPVVSFTLNSRINYATLGHWAIMPKTIFKKLPPTRVQTSINSFDFAAASVVTTSVINQHSSSMEPQTVHHHMATVGKRYSKTSMPSSSSSTCPETPSLVQLPLKRSTASMLVTRVQTYPTNDVLKSSAESVARRSDFFVQSTMSRHDASVTPDFITPTPQAIQSLTNKTIKSNPSGAAAAFTAATIVSTNRRQIIQTSTTPTKTHKQRPTLRHFHLIINIFRMIVSNNLALRLSYSLCILLVTVMFGFNFESRGRYYNSPVTTEPLESISTPKVEGAQISRAITTVPAINTSIGPLEYSPLDSAILVTSRDSIKLHLGVAPKDSNEGIQTETFKPEKHTPLPTRSLSLPSLQAPNKQFKRTASDSIVTDKREPEESMLSFYPLRSENLPSSTLLMTLKDKPDVTVLRQSIVSTENQVKNIDLTNTNVTAPTKTPNLDGAVKVTLESGDVSISAGHVLSETSCSVPINTVPEMSGPSTPTTPLITTTDDAAVAGAKDIPQATNSTAEPAVDEVILFNPTQSETTEPTVVPRDDIAGDDVTDEVCEDTGVPTTKDQESEVSSISDSVSTNAKAKIFKQPMAPRIPRKPTMSKAALKRQKAVMAAISRKDLPSAAAIQTTSR
ncbi:hypothetical protein HDU76_006453, partial [Blyttiomyces sp. JEL0837]